MLLDSGAFTAWSQGEEVTLDNLISTYWEFMDKYWSRLNEIYLINLDKIPGSPGRTPGKAEIDECIHISDENYHKLVALFGKRVLPVYHQGEDEARLAEVAAMTDYICVSPRNDVPERQRVNWAREVHGKLPSHIRTHGLAATGLEMMTTVPWHSVDSATTIAFAAYGYVQICINGTIHILAISDRTSAQHDYGKHFNTLDPITQMAIEDRIKQAGYTVERLTYDYEDRIKFSSFEILYWVRNYHEFKVTQSKGLFDL